MPTNKLYTVQVIASVVVLAESADEAQEYVEDHIEDIVVEHLPECDARDFTTYPEYWEGEMYPIDATEDADSEDTIDELIAAGAAPYFRGTRCK